ncbi:MAG TPA: amidohydrolase family protein [Allosphingosinicella sp.]|nr:amidohydrolase family protein [Allosphingosinicella sp.]
MKLLTILFATALLGAAAPPEAVDLIIRGGTIYTGSDAAFVGDVAISGGRIRAVGPRLPYAAARVIDARGMIVAPGFIDPHTHVGEQLADADARTRLIPAFLMQGVTTAFIGNDGGGDPNVASVISSAQRRPVGINYAAYVGFGAVRRAVIGDADRAPSADELARMRQMVAAGMCQGALGLSTGLFYAPQSFAATEEVSALAREAGTRGGVYDSHLRDESSYSIGLAAAVEEAITIGREGRLPVHISHIKALGVDVHGQAPAIIARIEAARAAGQRVTALSIGACGPITRTRSGEGCSQP